jgi:hypothetical protein
MKYKVWAIELHTFVIEATVCHTSPDEGRRITPDNHLWVGAVGVAVSLKETNYHARPPPQLVELTITSYPSA